jgi:hypothetical protein
VRRRPTIPPTRALRVLGRALPQAGVAAGSGPSVSGALGLAHVMSTTHRQTPPTAGRDPLRPRWALLSAIAVTAALATVLIAIAYSYGRENESLDLGRGLLWVGLSCIYVPIFARMLSPAVARKERLTLVFLAGVLLYVVKVLYAPTQFGGSDEYTHFVNAQHILDWGRLYTANSILPESANYPGLASAAAAVSLLTGMNLFVSSLIFLGVARVMLLIALFFVFERLTRSARVAGVAVLLYCANPNYLMWASQFAYESLSVPLMVVVLVCLLAERPRDREPLLGQVRGLAGGPPSLQDRALPTPAEIAAITPLPRIRHRERQRSTATSTASSSEAPVVESLSQPDPLGSAPWTGAALLLIAATAITHHLTSYALALLLWALVAITAWAGRPNRRCLVFALAATACSGAWLLLHGRSTVGYLADIFGRAVESLGGIIGGGQALHAPFQGNGYGATAAPDEIILAFAGVLLVGAGIVYGALLLLRARGRRLAGWLSPDPAGALTLVLAVGGIAWIGALALRAAPAAWEVANRSADFLFIAAALIMAQAATALADGGRRVKLRRAGVVACACLAFLGGTVLGWESYVRLARPTHVKVGDATIRPPSATVAAWAARNLPRSASIATDASSGRLLLQYGFRRVIAGAGTAAEALRAASGDWKRDWLSDNAIDYVIVDRRPSSADTRVGLTFARPDELREPLFPAAAIGDFERMPGATRVFDSGDIVVYDVTKVRRPGQASRRTFVAAAPRRQHRETAGFALALLGLALLPIVISVTRLRIRLWNRQHALLELDAQHAVASQHRDGRRRASALLATEVLAVTCVLALLVLNVLVSGPQWLNAVLGLPVALLLPGHAVMSVLFGRSQPPPAERLVVGVALSIAALIVAIVVLDAAGQRIDRLAMLSVLAALQLVALTTTFVRARIDRIPLRPLAPPLPRLAVAVSSALVVAVVVGLVGEALTIASRPSVTTSVAGYAALSVERDGSRGLIIDVESNELTPVTYEFELEARVGERPAAVSSLALAPGSKAQLRLPIGDRARSVVVVVRQRQRGPDAGRDLGPPLSVTLEPLSTGPAA